MGKKGRGMSGFSLSPPTSRNPTPHCKNEWDSQSGSLTLLFKCVNKYWSGNNSYSHSHFGK